MNIGLNVITSFVVPITNVVLSALSPPPSSWAVAEPTRPPLRITTPTVNRTAARHVERIPRLLSRLELVRPVPTIWYAFPPP
jgi:hypothetical protein